MNRILIGCFYLIIAGCTSKLPEKTIILSKEYSIKTSENFITRLDSNYSWRFVDAYTVSSDELNEELKKADGIILTGGADIHPARYGQIADTVKCGTIDTFRDSIEFVLLNHIDEFRTPCIGFCRGLQIMNVYNGGSLHLHLPDTLSSIHRGPEGKTTHTINVTKHISSVDIPVGQMNKIVSNHHQGISKLGDGLEVWATSPDGLSEGIRRSDTLNYPFYIGVQWHPELCEPGNKFDESIGQSFINALISE